MKQKPHAPHRSDPGIAAIYRERGFPTAVARHLGISHQAVQNWSRVPPEHVLDLAPLLNMTPEQIRPDIFNPRKGRWVFK